MQTRRFGGFCYSGVLVFGLAGTELCARAIPRAAIGGLAARQQGAVIAF